MTGESGKASLFKRYGWRVIPVVVARTTEQAQTALARFRLFLLARAELGKPSLPT